MSDTITILRSPRRRLAKLIETPDRIVSYEGARTFDAAEIEVRDLPRLAEIVRRLITRPDCCIVRGSLIGAPRQRNVRRLLHDQPDHPATLRDVPRRWLAIDVEGIALPPDVAADDLAGCAAAALQHLPGAFTGAAAVVQATGSHGLKPDMRLRLWFWLDRPTAGDELKRWLRNTPADPSIFSAAQIIYTSGPVFAPGLQDHLRTRIITLPGAPVVAVPDPAILAPPPPPPRAPSGPRTPVSAEAAERIVNGALARVRAAPDGAKHATLRNTALLLGGIAADAGIADADAVRWLLNALPASVVDEANAARTAAWGLAQGRARPITIPDRPARDDRHRDAARLACRLLRLGAAPDHVIAALHDQNGRLTDPLPPGDIAATLRWAERTHAR